MLLAGRDPDDVSGSHLLDRPTPELDAASARRDDQDLAPWM
jgi:hypothetical protein